MCLLNEAESKSKTQVQRNEAESSLKNPDDLSDYSPSMVERGIIQQASELMKCLDVFEKSLLDSRHAYDLPYDMFCAYCLCLRISLTREFVHSFWQNTPVQSYILRQSEIESSAVRALEHLESVVEIAGLEGVIYLAHLTVIGVEMRDAANRSRVLFLLHTIKNNGFLLAGTFISDLELAWKAVGWYLEQ